MWSGPLTMTSVMVGSASSGSSGPKPVTSWTISSTRRARSSRVTANPLLDDAIDQPFDGLPDVAVLGVEQRLERADDLGLEAGRTSRMRSSRAGVVGALRPPAPPRVALGTVGSMTGTGAPGARTGAGSGFGGGAVSTGTGGAASCVGAKPFGEDVPFGDAPLVVPFADAPLVVPFVGAPPFVAISWFGDATPDDGFVSAAGSALAVSSAVAASAAACARANRCIRVIGPNLPKAKGPGVRIARSYQSAVAYGHRRTESVASVTIGREPGRFRFAGQ